MNGFSYERSGSSRDFDIVDGHKHIAHQVDKFTIGMNKRKTVINN